MNVYKNDPTRWTEAKQDAVNGYAPTTCESWASSFANTNLSTTGVLAALRSSGSEPRLQSRHQPRGRALRRPGHAQINILGRDPTTGFARSSGDNTGVQYGLAALNSGAITTDDFIQLNEEVGGFDVNGNIVPQRSVGDPVALLRIYQSGLLNGGAGGLGLIPILTPRTYFDLLLNANNIHDRFEDFVIRARVCIENLNPGVALMESAQDAGLLTSSNGPLVLQQGPPYSWTPAARAENV